MIVLNVIIRYLIKRQELINASNVYQDSMEVIVYSNVKIVQVFALLAQVFDPKIV